MKKMLALTQRVFFLWVLLSDQICLSFVTVSVFGGLAHTVVVEICDRVGVVCVCVCMLCMCFCMALNSVDLYSVI